MGEADHRPHEQDQKDPTNIFSDHELLAEEDGDDDAKLNDQICGGEQKSELWDQPGPFGEQRRVAEGAAKEQDEEISPKNVPRATDLGPVCPMAFRIR